MYVYIVAVVVASAVLIGIWQLVMLTMVLTLKKNKPNTSRKNENIPSSLNDSPRAFGLY